jgi:hypothetical protein
MKFKFVLVCLLLGVFTSCGDTTNNKLIVGSWTGVEWIVNGNPSSQNPKETRFKFDENGNYTYSYGNLVEEGTYNVENEMLFTKPKGQLEIMVRISKLTKDSLVFDMNRGGQPEMLILVKSH